MRSLLLPLGCLVPVLLAAQVPRPTRWIQPGWSLVLPGSNRDARSTWQAQDAELARILACVIPTQNVVEAEWSRLLKEHALDPRATLWLLLDQRRKLVLSGGKPPRGSDLASALKRAGHSLPWERLQETLRTQRDHGEARLGMALVVLRGLSESRFSGREGEARVAEEVVRELMAVPEWPSRVDLPPAKAQDRLGAYLDRFRSGLSNLFNDMGTQVTAALALDPGSARLHANLAYLVPKLDLPRLLAILDVQGLPGQDWPPLQVAASLGETLIRRKLWSELELLTERRHLKVHRAFLSHASWEAHCAWRAQLETYHLVAISHRRTWSVTLPLFDDLRTWAGGDYAQLCGLALQLGDLPQPLPEEVSAKMKLEPLKGPAMPPLPPRCVLEVGAADLPALQAASVRDQTLAPWLPEELGLAARSSAKLARPGSIWGLFQGSRLLLEGDKEPPLFTLADLLRNVRPSRIILSDEAVGQHPEAPGFRAFRAHWLEERMPQKTLEPVLAEDLRLSRGAIPEPKWKLDESLWYEDARKVQIELDDQIRRWPLEVGLWKAHAFWTSFLPSHEGPAALLATLPNWDGGMAIPLRLPVEVHEEIGRTLQARKAHGPLRAWFSATWSALQTEGDLLPREASLGLAHTIQDFLVPALRRLGRDDEAAQTARACADYSNRRTKPGRNP